MKTSIIKVIEILRRFIVIGFIFITITFAGMADNYYNVPSLTGDVSQIDSTGGNVDIDLVFDGDIVTSISNGTVWDFTGSTITALNISGKPESTLIFQSGSNGRLFNIAQSPNIINFSNLNLSSFTFLDPNITSGVSRNGGALNFLSGGNNNTRNATFNNMIFNNNTINVTINYDSSFSVRGGALYLSGGFAKTTPNLINNGKNATFTNVDFTNNSTTLIDMPFITRKSKNATGGAAAILYYDVVKFTDGNISGNSVSADINGYVAGGGLYLSCIRNGSSISKINFTNNSTTLLTGGEGIAYAGAMFATQEYGGMNGNDNLIIPKTTLNVAESNFTNNHTTNNGTGEALGGAVVLLRDLDGVFDKTVFENNTVKAKSNYAGGGAIAIHSSYQDSIPLTDADRNNLKNQVTKFNETIFANNKAYSEASSGEGGAIYSTQRIETTKTNFIDNIAEGVNAFGGAIVITRTHSGTFYDSADTSKIQGGNFTNNKSIAKGGISLGGAIYTTKALEIISGADYGDVLFRDNLAVSNVTNSTLGNSIFADASVVFNAGEGSKIEDFDGHYISGNVTKVGGGVLSLKGAAQHQAGGYYIREGVLRSGFTQDGESGVRAIANLYGGNSSGGIAFDEGTIWELDLTNANMAKLSSGVRVADGDITGAENAIKLGNTLIDIEVVGGQIKLARILETARISDIYASTAYLHKWNTVYQAANTRINRLLYKYGAVHGGYLYGENLQVETLGQSYKIPVKAVAGRRNFYDAWVNYVGRKSAAESSYDVYAGRSFETISNGVQFGFDLNSGFGSHFGFMFGYEDSRGDVVDDYVRGDDYYVGFYGAMLFSYGIDIRGIFGFGHQRYKVARYDFGSEREFNVNPDGNTFEFNLEFGRRFQTWHNSSLRPFISIDYLANKVSGADEGAGGFRYDDLSLNQLYLRLGADVQWHFGALCFDAGAAFSQQLLDDYAKAKVSQGPISTSLRTSRYGNSIFTFNVGANYAFDELRSCCIFINYVGEVFVGGEAESINSLQTGIQWKF
ncbi:MAG: autotransporter outer membrane beta-barrel domain-containing protein [Planctomycetaceae bacterium]|jgi:hypothetical protein|nr:autotransporter outer membrane beta-barrel domain-containing protein [Planctomycetaceae bacterium]